ncbi:G-protein-signaling modulator 2 [Portunus trituberculatus]|uniref:G-protein-signaling modulator 2 n=1 Tax=Portunus trituberculatus TaxID=210409 RepID=A0A5B7JRG4_PORTR|nr:G-protein-signaling modulator 2 [Portunus trituberculatus]
MGDRLGVAKASGNLGNTLKVMGKFKEAICCCERHLSISQELEDKVRLAEMHLRNTSCHSTSEFHALVSLLMKWEVELLYQ